MHTHREKDMWRHSQKAGAIYNSRRETSEGPQTANTLILEFQPPEPGEDKSLFFKPLSLWYIFLGETEQTNKKTRREFILTRLPILTGEAIEQKD